MPKSCVGYVKVGRSSSRAPPKIVGCNIRVHAGDEQGGRTHANEHSREQTRIATIGSAFCGTVVQIIYISTNSSRPCHETVQATADCWEDVHETMIRADSKFISNGLELSVDSQQCFT